MKAEQQAALRAEFPASRIGKLPKGGVELDYCGHGAVTDRLLEVDPEWNWEPLSFDEQGLPRFTVDAQGNPIAFWIRLTVAGVTRLGCGTCKANQFDAEKVLIGDALRNAAMRFGVALDLWIKGHAEDDERRVPNDPAPERAPLPSEKATPEQRGQIEAWLARAETADANELRAWWKAQQIPAKDKLTFDQADRVLEHMARIKDRGPAHVLAGAGVDNLNGSALSAAVPAGVDVSRQEPGTGQSNESAGG